MQGLANRYSALLQSQSAESMKFSRLTAGKNEESRTKNKEMFLQNSEEQEKGSKEGKEKEKNKNSKAKSNEKRKISNSKPIQSSTFHPETPLKIMSKKQERLIDRYSNSIVDLLEESQGLRLRGKIKALLQDFTANLQVENNMSTSVRVSVGDRAYRQLQEKYLESQKERQYLRGKMEVNVKRYQELEREAERHSKIDALIDQSIQRQKELRRQVSRVQTEKALLEAQLEQQNATFSKEVQAIHSLIQSLKVNLPIN